MYHFGLMELMRICIFKVIKCEYGRHSQEAVLNNEEF
jgi:hypothetical protein